jgi:hypothetical protein
MTTVTPNLVAVTPGGDITADMLAGYYLLYSIGEGGVPIAKTRKAFKDHGLDVSRLPEARRPEHVAMAAVKSVERVHQNGHREVIRTEQVGRSEAFVIFQVTRHVFDLENRVIEHPKALRVLFSMEDLTLTFEPLEGADMIDVQAIAKEIQDYYDSHGTQIPGRGLRRIIQHYVEAAGGEFIRDGGYFLPRVTRLTQNSKLRDHHGEEIDAASFIANLQSALREIYERESEMHSIPCVNDDGQRAFLKRKFIENCSEDLKAYRDRCVELVNGKDERKKAFRTDVRTGLIARRKDLNARRQQFAEILGETLEELDRDMSLADAALMKFIEEADA